MSRRTFIRKSSCDRVRCYFLVHTFKINKIWIDFIKRFPRYSQVVKNFFRLYLRKSSCVRVEIFAVSIPSIHLSNKQKRTRLSLAVYISFAHGRIDPWADRHFSKKFSFFLLDQQYICMSIPISIISQILSHSGQS